MAQTKPVHSPIRRQPTDPKLLPGQPDYLIVRPLRDNQVEVIHPQALGQKLTVSDPKTLWHILIHPEYYFSQPNYKGEVKVLSRVEPDPQPRPRYIMNDQGQIVKMARTGKTQHKRETERLGDLAEF